MKRAVVILLFWSTQVGAFEVVLELKRVIVMSGTVQADTYVAGNLPRGLLVMEIAGDMTIAAMRFDAYLGDEELIFEDGIAVGYVQSGGRYEFYSLVRSELFDVTFLRRELESFSPDPAIIFIVSVGGDDLALLDYRFPK